MTGDLLDLLDEILAAENAPRVDVAPTRRHNGWLPCGRHEAWREDDEHVVECWGSVCPSCREPVANGFLYRLNHEAAEHGVCGSIVLRLNHLTAYLRLGGVHVLADRDLTVLDLGYRLGPDGSHIYPDGTVHPVLNAHEREKAFARWAS